MDKYRPLSDPNAQDVPQHHSANRTNARVDNLSKVFKVLGPVATAGSVAYGAKRIADSDTPIRESLGVAGSIAGGVLGGIAGSAAGTATLGPGPGTVFGGVGGSMTGSNYGEKLGYWFHDWARRQRLHDRK